MKFHRRSAAWTCAFLVVLSLAGWTWRVTRPEHLRPEIERLARSFLALGWDVRIDAVDYDLAEGLVRIEGLRIFRKEARHDVVVRIPKAEFETRLWTLAQMRLLGDVRLYDPEVVVERNAAGEFVLGSAFAVGEGGGEGGARPRITVEGGLVRFRDPALLGVGEEVRLDVASIDWDESRSGKPSPIKAVFLERGSLLRRGAGSLGRVAVSGDLPISAQGLHVTVDRFECDEFLRERLSAAVKEQIAPISVIGTFGEGSGKPGLQVDVAKGKEGLSYAFTLRPRGVNILYDRFPLLFTGTRGDATWKDGALRLDHFALYYATAEIRVNGSVDRISGDARCDLQFWARNFYLDRALRKALPPAVNRVWDAYDFAGVVDLTAAPPGEPGSYDSWIRRRTEGGPLELQITARFVDGEMSYRGYPGEDGVRRGFDWPLTGITGQVTVTSPVDSDGAFEIHLQDVVGRRGDTQVTAHGSVKEWPGGSASVDISIEAGNVPLDQDMRDASPAMERIFHRWSPRGKASRILVHVDQVPGVDHGAHESVTVEMDGKAGFTYEDFPVPLEEVSGTIRDGHPLLDGNRTSVLEIDAVRGSTSDGAAIEASGTIQGEDDPHLNLRVDARTLFLDGVLETAIRERKATLAAAVDVWDRLRPSGPVDAVIEVAGTESRRRETYHVTLRGGSVQGWGDVKYPVAALEGIVDVSPEEIRIRDVRGLHDGSVVRLDGAVADPGGAARLDLGITADGIPLDESAKGILGHVAERLGGYFATVKPKAGLTGNVDLRLTGPAEDIEAAVRLSNLRGGLAPLDLRDFALEGGAARYAKGVVTLEGLQGAMGDRRVTVERGRLDLDRGEGDLDLVVRRLRFPRDLLGILEEDTTKSIEDALPGRFIHSEDLHILLTREWRRIEMRGHATLSPQKEGSMGGLGLEGNFLLGPLVLDRGAGPGDPTAVSGAVDFTRGALEAGVKFDEMEGRLDLGGSLGPGGEGIRARMSGAKGRVEGRELRDTAGDLLLKEGLFRATGLVGTLARGQLGASVEVGGDRGGYEVKVALANAGARALFAPANPDSRLVGQVSIDYRVATPTGRIEDLGGRGSVDIANAELLDVPVFFHLFSFLKFQKPPVFNSGRIVFDVKGDRFIFDQLDLESSELGLHKAVGQSQAWTDGRLAIRLRPDIKSISEPWFLFKIPLGLLNLATRPMFERLYTLYVGGTIQHPEVSHSFFHLIFKTDDKSDHPRPVLPPPATPLEMRPEWGF